MWFWLDAESIGRSILRIDFTLHTNKMFPRKNVPRRLILKKEQKQKRETVQM